MTEIVTVNNLSKITHSFHEAFFWPAQRKDGVFTRHSMWPCRQNQDQGFSFGGNSLKKHQDLDSLLQDPFLFFIWGAIKMQRWSRKTPPFPLLASLFCVFVVASILYNENNRQFHVEREAASSFPSFPTPLPPNISARKTKRADFGRLDWSKACISTRSHSVHEAGISRTLRSDQWDEGPRSCDIFSGRWVFDNDSYPLYNESDCPYMSDQLACQKHGRPDSTYQKWRWQPHNCNLKRWNGTEMLEKLRGKRLMFVGDSLNRGQWISMVCLLQSAIGNGKKSMSPNAALTIFRAEEYNATVEFYWAPLIVESNSDDPVNHRLDSRIIRPDSVLKHASEWEKADILVFNTYLWWRQGNIKLLWSDEEDGVCEELSGIGAMKLALEAWAEWVASNVDPRKKRIFYVTMSPTHLWSREWQRGSEGNCLHEKVPIDRESYWGSGSDVPTMGMVENVLGQLRSKVSVINITQLSEYRKDGHPSIYRKFWEAFSPQQLANPVSYADCIHWCLPGVPDVWNEFVFNLL